MLDDDASICRLIQAALSQSEFVVDAVSDLSTNMQDTTRRLENALL